MSLEAVVSILGPGQEVPETHVAQYGESAARIVEGKKTVRVVQGDRYFLWRVAGGTFWVSFKDNTCIETHYANATLF
jgi:hypothetical protein